MMKSPLGSATEGAKQDHATSQRARIEAFRQADLQRTQKRLDKDADIDVHAAKWRYVPSGA
ncbi:hypothetical protein [Caballeronia sp. RCC_10]|jgi:hypothetical protein|uniref:Transcriptional regulator n=2 Tax=Caballeronia grimmiae TaxID=1071679 RepID=A0ABQ1RV93_9BURK|nr:hypothetical protein GCM10010985_37130 [Caballeronia grimmiae]